ncbi:MAG: hypothetical protein CMG00_00005 [Candidatus Marinimicrobia bacterium]|nr:hypothetical protein [Candidatus Neomarinimicrobiota bacterium]
MNTIISGTILIVIIISILFLISKKSPKIRESFDNVCDGCRFPNADRMFKNPMKSCRLYGCDRDGRNIPQNRARKWNNGKTNTIVKFSQDYINTLKGYDFGNFSNQENYADKLETYLRDLSNNFKRYIDKASQHPWSTRFDGDFDRSRADNCMRIVNNCHTILSDIKSANDYVNNYYQVDVNDTRGSSNQDLINLRNRLARYVYNPGDYSDIGNSDLNNNFRASNSNFWRAIYSSWYTLEYLRVLIAWYPNGPLMGSMRAYLRAYNVWFNGSSFPPYNINQESLEDVNHVYKWQKNRLAGYAGNNYQSSGSVSDTRGGIDINYAPLNVRYNAYSNFLYENLGNCQQKYSNFDYWRPYHDRYWQMNWARSRMSGDDRKNDIYAQKNTINYTKNLFWEPNNGTTWRPNQTEENYRTCEALPESTSETETESSSSSYSSPNIYNFKEHSDNLETKRKKIQYARKDVYSSLVGQDATLFVNEPLPNCPAINNQSNLKVTEWTRSNDTIQPSICKSRDSFAEEPSNYRVSGTMKPGSIINGKDIWLENYENITTKVDILKEITENTKTYSLYKDTNNRWQWRKDHRHTTLIRQAGGMKERILKDRDWQLSTQRWEDKDKLRDSNNALYFKENYLTMYTNYTIRESPIYDFEIEFKESDEPEKYNTSIIFIAEAPLKVSNIKINSMGDKPGVIKLYHNMYKYSYFLTTNKDNENSLINFPSIPQKKTSLLSVVYQNLNWEKEELIEYGYDLYIVCCNNNNIHNLYSNSIGFLYYREESQFGKIFYANKNSSEIPSDNFRWTIFTNPETGTDMIFNKKTETFLSFGINYQLENNFNLATGIPLSNANLDDNKEIRKLTLYFVKKETLEELNISTDVKDKRTFNEMMSDCQWIIKKKKGNQYSITHSDTGRALWFTSASILASQNEQSTSVDSPLTDLTGYVNISQDSYVSEEEGKDEGREIFCDDFQGESCFNKYFYIVPTEPEDVSSQFTTSNELYERDLFKNCPNVQGNNTLDKNKWYRTISEANPMSYADMGELEQNRYKNLYKMYGQGGNYIKGVLTLDGGGGDNCSKSNYCHVERKLLSSDNQDKVINPVEASTEANNKQTKSQSLLVRIKDWFNRPNINKNFQVPLNKYNYQCNRNQFNIYKLFGNKTDIMFNTTKNPNMETSQDDSYDVNDTLREVAISIYSLNRNYVEGRDFGVFPDGTSVWFVTFLENNRSNRTHLNTNQLRIIKKNRNDLHKDFVFLSNMTIDSSRKRKKQKIITWADEIKFKNIGYQDFSKEKTFAYQNMTSSYLN